ncbi:carbamoyltransferase [Pseudobacteroides cellulosolvens]|uniref:Carbamoyltransferase n=1 Tax=Pseudobacteroides cellulosolvens ATCC 35603 = DSM 2933 TaxID=398512 RepID=A0A0L6JJ18_9FIRM|nr:carbamoyltransferase [Pseudobacteroides cellulosolvens]KNY25715.1 Carbamoyltransferase [Pseudobacteroides cellulosolvens ATCC 35603 = DSM 2933]
MEKILGISAYYHDSAAALLVDGVIIAAAQEERFTRKKQDERFPVNAVNYCLSEAKISIRDVDKIVYYEKPLLKFERLLETYISCSPRGFASYIKSMPIWLKEKLFLKKLLKTELASLGNCKVNELPQLLFTEHHMSHAASAFYPSPFKKAAVLCVDGVGEWATTSVWMGEDNSLTPLWQMDFPHSLGLLYSAFTYYTGFKVNSGEYKLMGLAPYGNPTYVDLILDNIIDLKDDGTFRLNMKYFNYTTGLTMTSNEFHKLFGGPPRKSESVITQREMDIARSIQQVTEEIILRLSRTIKKETGAENLCLAGGVALNCVANGRVLSEGIFKDIWIQPASGDSGGALGAALSVWHQYLKQPRNSAKGDSMKGSYLGPSQKPESIKDYLDSVKAKYKNLNDDELYANLAKILVEGKVIGWFQGRMEFGPRALGGRSIIGDPRNSKMQSVMNLKIKYRESFRPFAPSVLHEKAGDYFQLDHESPYMLLVAPVVQDIRVNMTKEQDELFGIEKLNVARSSIPAVTHVDYSARVQTVHEETNPRYYRLIKEFGKLSGCSVIVNTSFNVRGEPIVCTAEDAYRCFMRTDMDYLVLENFILAKNDQPKVQKDESWKTEFELD